MISPLSKVKEIEPTLELEEARDPHGFGGLLVLVEGVERSLPLQEVKVRATIAGNCCRTVVDQRFRNDLELPMEAVHIFPLPEDGAVIEMELRVGDRVVRAECREREEAERIFKQALEEGHRAGLLTQERADVHTLRVTNLPPGSEVTVRIVVVERLSARDGLLRWRFPTVVAPRYLPGEPVGHEGAGILPDTDHVPDASHLQPPLRLEGGVQLDLQVEILGSVHKLESSLHAVQVEIDQEDGRYLRIAPSVKATLDRDFELAFSFAREKKPDLQAWTDGSYTLVFLEPPDLPAIKPLARDAVFIIDVSGSMKGHKIEAARLALKTALHGLQVGDRFKLIAFSNSISSFSEGFSEYTQEALKRADEWIGRLRASGGTEMLPAIKEALSGEFQEGRLRTVLFITDGQAWNEAELTAAVFHRRGEALFFTMGIDTAVNASMLKRLARAGGGTCELLTPDEDIEAAVASFEARFGSPLTESIRVTGGEAADDRPLTLFTGRPVSTLLEGASKKIKVVGKTTEGEFVYEAKSHRVDFPLGALWARERVAALEDRLFLEPHKEEALRPEILRVALQHNIASRYTAFVVVDTSVTTQGERIEIVQPAELPHGWDPGFLQMRSPSLSMSLSPIEMKSIPPAQDRIAMDISPVMAKPSIGEIIGKATSISLDSPTHEAKVDSLLARSQDADGSFGGDVSRTIAAMLALLLLGYTRRKGLRKRTVLKASLWLEGQSQDPNVELAMEVLRRAEEGDSIREYLRQVMPELETFFSAGEEGRILKRLLEQ